MVNPFLTSYVKRRLHEATVILSFRILLQNHLAHGIDARMTKTEIETEFNRVHMQYGIATFRRDYVLRQCGQDENAIDQNNDLFFVKPEFLENMEEEDYQTVLSQIDEHWGAVQNQQQLVIEEIQQLLDTGSQEEQRTYIVDMLTTREAVKRGQAFEVSSYAVLSTYLYSLGFLLNRFSTKYSNDGGIDFVGQSAVYQVTTKLSKRKFEEDIKKVPGKERVLVYKDMVRDFDTENLKHELVLNQIDKHELITFLDYLINKNPKKYLDRVLNTMMGEFQREFYQNEIE